MSMFLLSILAAGVIGGLDHHIVTPEWLQQNLSDPYVVVVEIGSSQQAEHPHIPGARYVAIESIVNRNGWPPDELPPVEQLRQAFGNAGVGDDGRIVLYSADPLYATRAWFTLDYLGQGDRTAILNGGFEQWQKEKRPVATKRFARLPKTFTAHPDPTRLVSLSEVRDAINEGAELIDARPSVDFYGFRRGAKGDAPRAYPRREMRAVAEQSRAQRSIPILGYASHEIRPRRRKQGWARHRLLPHRHGVFDVVLHPAHARL
jgi:thiosulfate/3-mercaptopyruvate sulfurtransferase